MADDEDKPETPAETPTAEELQAPVTDGHAVPTEDATEIAGSAEDAPLEALQEAQQAGTESPGAETESPGEAAEPFEPTAGHAVPTEEATEIAGSAEDAPLEAAQERAEAEIVEEAVAEEIVAEVEVELEEEIEEEPTPRVKPSVPGAHLEVDIVPEGVDPLGRSEAYEDPYAIEGEEPERGDDRQEEQEEVLTSRSLRPRSIWPRARGTARQASARRRSPA